MSKKVCTPFCVEKRPCPKHHDLLIALVNCGDSRSSVRRSLDNLESTVKTYVKKGWNKDDDVDDPVKLFRFPLVHWASVLGKCTALEWMLDNGFSSTIRSSQSKETALHRCIMCLYRSGIRRPDIKMTRIVELLKDCLMLQDEDLDTPLHVAAKRLVRGSKPDYYGLALEIMILQARVMPGKTAQIIDCSNKSGNTIAHILAQNDVCIATVRKVLESGTDLLLKNQDDLTPLDVAINSGSTRIAQAMTAHGKKAQTQQQLYDSTSFMTESPPESPVPSTDEPESPTHDAPQQEEEEFTTASETSDVQSIKKEEDFFPVFKIKEEIFDPSCYSECPTCHGCVNLNDMPSNPCCDRTTQCHENSGTSEEKKATSCDSVTQCRENSDTSEDNKEIGCDSVTQCHENSDTSENNMTISCDSVTQCHENSDTSENNMAISCDSVTQCHENSDTIENNMAISCDSVTQCHENSDTSENNMAISCDSVTQCHENSDTSEGNKAISCDSVTQCHENSDASENNMAISCDSVTQCHENSDTSEDKKEISCDSVTQCQENSDSNENKNAVWCDSATEVVPGDSLKTSTAKSKPMWGKYFKDFDQATSTLPPSLAFNPRLRKRDKDLDSSLITYLKGAGLLRNVTRLANKTRVEDENSLKLKLQSVQAMNETIGGLEKEMENQEKALEELKTDLKRLSGEKDTVHAKRKRVNEECSDLQTKLHCCDNLLRCVPRFSDESSE